MIFNKILDYMKTNISKTKNKKQKKDFEISFFKNGDSVYLNMDSIKSNKKIGKKHGNLKYANVINTLKDEECHIHIVDDFHTNSHMYQLEEDKMFFFHRNELFTKEEYKNFKSAVDNRK